MTTAIATAPVLRLRGLMCQFGGVVAVSNVDLDINGGERRAILGPNGAGKTTLFNLISGEVFATAGTVEAFGADITFLPSRSRARLGLTRTFQTSRLFAQLTVTENVYLGMLGVAPGHLRPFRLPADRATRRQACQTAERVGLGQRVDTVVGELSHGEQRQLEIAVALAGNPRVLMLDEPASGLSPAERAALTELLLALDPGVTLLVVEHDMDVALRVAQWVTVMHEGKVIAEGAPNDIRANTRVHDLYLGRGFAPVEGEAAHA